jgi:6-phosphofructokinase
MNKHIGILTAGGDNPGLNAAIRAKNRLSGAGGCRLSVSETVFVV